MFVTEHTLIFVSKGAKVFRFPKSEVVVEAGKAIFLKRGCYLLCESVAQDYQYESISIFFNESTLQNFWLGLEMSDTDSTPISSENKEMVILDMSPALDAFRDTILNCFSYKGSFLEQLLTMKLQELLLLLLDTPIAPELKAFFGEIFDENRTDPEYVVSENMLTPLSLEDYARLSNRSLSSFKRAFKQKTGQTPGTWILENRLKHARMLVQATTKTVGEIGAESGFGNISSFIRSYRTRFGTTPAADRNSA
ncbi:helix-turn-helix domain-containing protein [Pelagicoccus mobilis]|uniref:Helix-turn-helix domain-containing protein n=1 Tax=Pelagicoccus mobilis TaxID=415221 RepID=A0A934VRB9_9BACT|nr:helix-turn-helix domain-containing protein [Pelagicoccus mobilis]MBK1877463.1 helix-turn-helix domain-containing protein [Pelagicoccus mobilis]